MPILIDGRVQLAQTNDSLRQLLNDWIRLGSSPANVANIRARMIVTFNTRSLTRLNAGAGLDWFWEADAQTDRKPTDELD